MEYEEQITEEALILWSLIPFAKLKSTILVQGKIIENCAILSTLIIPN